MVVIVQVDLIGSGAGQYVYHDGNTKFENATGYLKYNVITHCTLMVMKFF